ncbi:serine carboxypeptidase-like 51 [Euphorbia peplus]|nr:serine carboxypeptidase-like 51 [Euphorbia peplus]
MDKHSILFISLVFFCPLIDGYLVSAVTSGTLDGSEQWGYVEVRPKAHLFWWLYKSPYRVEDPSKPWPVILWLQGGPGGSSVGLGNFLEIGPLDVNLNPRNSTWLHKADLLFVDSPVSTGFSYVENGNKSLLVKTDYESATDLTTLLKEVFNGDDKLQKSPLYIFAESYGGKFAVTLGITALKAIEAGELKLQLGGVALGDSWISPEDFVFSWGPLLKDLSRMNNNGLNISNSLALKIQQQLASGDYGDATITWNELEGVILDNSNDVDFYNFMLDGDNDPVEGSSIEGSKGLFSNRYSTYLISKYYSTSSATPGGSDGLYDLLNGPIKEKLKIIPENVTWGGQGGVFSAMIDDFMKPRIQEVDDLLAKGTKVFIYNGQVDLICSTKGAESWVNKLKWEGLENFQSEDRTPLYCKNDTTTTKAFTSSYKNLAFYWILGAGHFVPVDQPCISLQMVGSITQSPNVDF